MIGIKRSVIDDGRSDLSEERRLETLTTAYVCRIQFISDYGSLLKMNMQLPRNAMETEEQQEEPIA